MAAIPLPGAVNCLPGSARFLAASLIYGPGQLTRERAGSRPAFAGRFKTGAEKIDFGIGPLGAVRCPGLAGPKADTHLTFDMNGGHQHARRAGGRRLDGAVRLHFGSMAMTSPLFARFT